MPDQWEWSCDYCGKTSHTNSQATRPPGWVPRGRTVGHVHDFCSPEHETAFNNKDAPPADSAPAGPAEAEPAVETGARAEAEAGEASAE